LFSQLFEVAILLFRHRQNAESVGLVRCWAALFPGWRG